MKALSIWNACKLAAVLAVLLPLASLKAAPPADNAKINQLLDQARVHAALADDDADELVSYTRSPLSWQSHAIRLETIKGHVNDLIEDVNTLSAMREQGSPWQKTAIDRIDPLLKEIAQHLSMTIQHLSDNPTRIHVQQYRDYVNANRELINRAHNVIGDLVEYGQAKAKTEALEVEHELDTDKSGA